MRNSFTKIGVIVVILLTSGCSSVKRVPEEDLLLTKNTLIVDDKKVNDDDIRSLIHQQPNSSLLGFPVRLHMYNLAKPSPDSFYIKKLNTKLMDSSFAEKLLSEKQLRAWTKTKIGISKWLMETGEAPAVIDTSITRKSVERLESYYTSKGYFNNSGTFKVDTLNRKKRGELTYTINLKQPYILDSITKNIASPDLDSLYMEHRKNSIIKQGRQFDLLDFQRERNRLTSLFRNSGVYNFQQSSIEFDIHRDTISGNQDFTMPVTVQIANASRRINDSIEDIPYRIHKIKHVNLYVDTSPAQATDSVNYDNYTLYFNKQLQYRPKALTDAVFLDKDSIYRDIDYAQTLRQLNNLQSFKYPSIQRIPDTVKTKLNVDIYLNSRPKFSLNFNTDITHSNIQDFGISFSTSLISRNVFRGAETLEISARGSLGSSREVNDPDDKFFNVTELGADIKLNFPRIWVPFNSEKIIPKYMSPQTSITLGTSIQENIGLDKQTFNSVLQYNWNPSAISRNVFELMNIQFIRNVNPERFFEVYQNTYQNLNDIARQTGYILNEESLIIPIQTNAFINDVKNGTLGGNISPEQIVEVNRIEERRQRLTENNLIFATNFTHTRNTRQGLNDNSFSQFRGKIEFAGNLLSTIANAGNFEKNENGSRLVFGVPYSQYAKTEFDYIKHWEMGRSEVLALRGFLGIAIPYGNSNSIPFSRSYFAGGSNDNRAWQAYSLGPGSTEALNDFNEANFKLALNLEYRFDVFGDLKGALFADAGNIWNVFDSEENPKATLDGFSSLKDIALGTGFGLRYDFSFFVLRFDTGFKTYNPARALKDRWFQEYNFANAVFNIGINYPF